MSKFVDGGLVLFDCRYNECDIIVREDDSVLTLQKIDLFPWSGHPLPQSLRDLWFDEFEKMGVDPMNDPIPEQYQDGSWRVTNDLQEKAQ